MKLILRKNNFLLLFLCCIARVERVRVVVKVGETYNRELSALNKNRSKI